jgi:hypothetical protein
MGSELARQKKSGVSLHRIVTAPMEQPLLTLAYLFLLVTLLVGTVKAVAVAAVLIHKRRAQRPNPMLAFTVDAAARIPAGVVTGTAIACAAFSPRHLLIVPVAILIDILSRAIVGKNLSNQPLIDWAELITGIKHKLAFTWNWLLATTWRKIIFGSLLVTLGCGFIWVWNLFGDEGRYQTDWGKFLEMLIGVPALIIGVLILIKGIREYLGTKNG